MYAVVQTGGKQYRVQSGDILEVEKLEAAVGEKVQIDQVLVAGTGESLQIGTPILAEACVEGTVLAQDKGPKIYIVKTKKRKGYRRKNGHRQPLTRIRIETIRVGDQVLAGPVVQDEPHEAELSDEAVN